MRSVTQAQSERRGGTPPLRRTRSLLCIVLACVVANFARVDAAAAAAAGASVAAGAAERPNGSAKSAPARTAAGGRPTATADSSTRPTAPAAPPGPVAPTGLRRAETVPQPMEGALGIQFDVPLPAHLRGGALPGTPLALPADVHARPIDTRPGVAAVWTAVLPPTVPQLLHSHQPPTAYAVMLDNARRPVRILAELQSGRCQSLYVALGKRLAERYGNAEEATAPAGTEYYSLFRSAQRFVQLSCSADRLRLDYVDGKGFAGWQTQHETRIALYDRDQRLALAARVAPDRDGRIESAFGVRFGHPCAINGVLPDINAGIEPPVPLARWPGARYELMVDPDGFPIRVSAIMQFTDVGAAAAEKDRLVAALTERYGQPRRSRPLYSVITRRGRHAVVIRDRTEVSLVFMDNRRMQAQRARLQQRQSEVAKAAERQRAAERAGL